MAIGRYAFTSKVNKDTLATSPASWKIFQAIEEGSLSFSSKTLKGGERLDHIAAKSYGSPGLWWIIAAASGIGWGLQVPPGTIIRVPTSASAAINLTR